QYIVPSIDAHGRQLMCHQNIYVIEMHSYVYLVPFVEDKDKIFLKTIFPHRKATKKYLIKEGNEL
ncbi:MAG: hypothetical protein WCG04_06150, partial [Alphaproteobacteria bacterium]